MYVGRQPRITVEASQYNLDGIPVYLWRYKLLREPRFPRGLADNTNFSPSDLPQARVSRNERNKAIWFEGQVPGIPWKMTKILPVVWIQ